MKNNRLMFLTIFIMFGILSFLMIRVPSRIAQGADFSVTWTSRDQIEYANKLAAKGLNAEAASALENFINNSMDDRKKLAKVCYRLGGIYMKMYEYRNALRSFYRAEMLDSKGDFINGMNQKIVEALENTGMSAQAKYELDARTSLNKRPEQKTEKIIARVGNEEITEQEINRAVDSLPEWLRKHVQTEEGRKNFISDYVAKEVLYRKAKRLGFDRTPEAKEAIEELKKQLAVQQLIQKEIKEKVIITPDDLKLYYKANKDKYVEETGEGDEKEKRQMTFDEVKSRVEQEYMLKKQSEVTNALLKKALEDQEVEIYAVEESKKEEADKK